MPGKKQNNNKSGAARRNKERKQEEAVGRQNVYNSLSAIEKVNLIKSRRGESKREMNKLLTELA